jgi:hypothetical protein
MTAATLDVVHWFRLCRSKNTPLLLLQAIVLVACHSQAPGSFASVPAPACTASQNPRMSQLYSEWFRTVGRKLSDIVRPIALLDERPLNARPAVTLQNSERVRVRVSGPLLGQWQSEYSWGDDRTRVELVAQDLVYGGTSASAYNGKLTGEQVEHLDRCVSELFRSCLPTVEQKDLAPSTIDGVESSFEYAGHYGALALVRVSPSQDAERRHLTQYNACMCQILSMPFSKPGSAARVFCSSGN